MGATLRMFASNDVAGFGVTCAADTSSWQSATCTLEYTLLQMHTGSSKTAAIARKDAETGSECVRYKAIGVWISNCGPAFAHQPWFCSRNMPAKVHVTEGGWQQVWQSHLTVQAACL